MLANIYKTNDTLITCNSFETNRKAGGCHARNLHKHRPDTFNVSYVHATQQPYFMHINNIDKWTI